MKVVLVLAVLFAFATANPLSFVNGNDRSQTHCKNVMNTNGLTSRFPGVVAHALHSLTLQDIRYYFEPTASSNTKLPTINQDISSGNPILFTVVDAPNTNTFSTMGMKVVDQVLSHMDDENYMAKGYSPLENIVHGLHMHEEWQKVSDAYKTLKANPPADKTFCSCVLDIEGNGVFRMLRYTALKLREPKLMYGAYEKINNGMADWSGNLYNFPFADKSVNSDSDNMINKHYNFKYSFPAVADFNNGLPSKEEAISAKKSNDNLANWSKHHHYNFKYKFPAETDLDNELVRKEKGFPSLDSSAHWKVWKKAAESHVMNDYKEAASFLYCALNDHAE